MTVASSGRNGLGEAMKGVFENELGIGCASLNASAS
jgi:hypothetical protein